jgi:ABC-type multidrug transport system ATPase subunit
MSVEQGLIYGFLGMNGAGKTTVFKILTGLLKPSTGETQLLGMDTTPSSNKYYTSYYNAFQSILADCQETSAA